MFCCMFHSVKYETLIPSISRYYYIELKRSDALIIGGRYRKMFCWNQDVVVFVQNVPGDSILGLQRHHHNFDSDLIFDKIFTQCK